LRNVNRVFRTVVTASALAFVSIAAHAATVHLTGDLKASAEVPSKDSPGAGTVTATLDTETNEFKYHVEFSGLTGPVVAAHFHGPAAVGANAKPQLPITNPTCHFAVERMCQITSPIDGMATLTPEKAKELVDGKWYFNLHTSANPGGEIRGQILKSAISRGQRAPG
jgi:CHRD domain